jgi:hypothetical protein
VGKEGEKKAQDDCPLGFPFTGLKGSQEVVIGPGFRVTLFLL